MTLLDIRVELDGESRILVTQDGQHLRLDGDNARALAYALMAYAHAQGPSTTYIRKGERFYSACRSSIRLSSRFQNRHRVDAPTQTPKLVDLKLLDLELSPRLLNILDRYGVRTLGDLMEQTEERLMAIRKFGPICLSEVRDLLAGYGLSLKNNP